MVYHETDPHSCAGRLIPKRRAPRCVVCGKILWTPIWIDGGYPTHNKQDERLGFVPNHRKGPACYMKSACQKRAPTHSRAKAIMVICGVGIWLMVAVSWADRFQVSKLQQLQEQKLQVEEEQQLQYWKNQAEEWKIRAEEWQSRACESDSKLLAIKRKNKE